MTVGELKAILEEYDDGLEVRFMGQPNYPYEFTIAGYTDRAEMVRAKAYEDEDDEDGDGDGDGDEDAPPVEFKCRDFDGTPGAQCVFLLEGRQVGYGSKVAWEVSQGGGMSY